MSTAESQSGSPVRQAARKTTSPQLGGAKLEEIIE